MEGILSVLRSIRDDIDYSTCEDLISGKILRSFDIINLISELEERFDIEIEPEERISDNFDSLKKIEKLVSEKAGK